MSDKVIDTDKELQPGVVADDFNVSSFEGLFNDPSSAPDFVQDAEKPAEKTEEETKAEELAADAEATASADKAEADAEAARTDAESEEEGEEKEDVSEEAGEKPVEDAEVDDDSETSLAAAIESMKMPEGARDYGDFTAEETKIVKQTSNKAFQYIQGLKAKNAELAAAQLDSGSNTMVSSEQVTLTKEYRETQGAVDLAANAITHLKAQLIAVKKGEPFAPLEKNAQGEIVAGPQQDSSVEGEVMINEQLSSLQGIHSTFQEELAGLKATHKVEVEGSVAALDNLVNSFAPEFSNAESKIYGMVDAIEAKMPKVLQGNVVTRNFAKASAMVLVQANQIKALQKKLKGKARNSADDRQTVKKGDSTNSDEAKASITMASFEALAEGR
jgi:hypothetical protein